MKWTRTASQHGDKRTIKRFLILPRWVGDEVRWLCTVRIVQEFDSDGEWIDLYFEDNQK